MAQLELNDQEQELLAEVLRMFLSDLHTEVSHTDNRSFRAGLKDQEHLIRHILSRLEGR